MTHDDIMMNFAKFMHRYQYFQESPYSCIDINIFKKVHIDVDIDIDNDIFKNVHVDINIHIF